MNDEIIYLDYSAHTPADKSVIEKFAEIEQKYYGNCNSGHILGKMAKNELDNATCSIAEMFKILPEEIIYTSGASESNNLAIKGIAYASRHIGKHIISSPLEHSSISATLTSLQSKGYEIDMCKINKDGKIDLEDFKSLLRKDTILAAFSYVDSELGTIQPIKEISEILKDYPDCKLHVDATQAIGKTDVNFDGIDTLSFSAHKFYGLLGVGFLFKKKGLILEPQINGGTSTTLYRSGTPTLALDVSMAYALKLVFENTDRTDKVKKLNTKLRCMLSVYPDVKINSPLASVPHILNLSVKGIKGKDFAQKLSDNGVCISVKSACSSDNLPSRAVMAVSKDRKNALSSMRISLSHITTEDELEKFLKIFDKCYKELKNEKT